MRIETDLDDAAAMREALVKIREKCVIYNNDLAEEIDALCGNALSAPARNCDVYKTPEDCMRAFESYVREHGKLGFINPFTEVVKWLLAPAAEQKGGVE